MTTTKQKNEDLRKEVIADVTEIQKVVKNAPKIFFKWFIIALGSF